MRTRTLTLFTVAAALLLLVAVAWAATRTPANMNVQGRLTWPDGEPVASITQTFIFKIFDAEAGGTEIWPAGPGEDHSITTDIEGIWSATIGSTIPLSGDVFADTSRWLEITIVDGGDPPVTLSRIKINSTPYVWQAGYADSASKIDDLSVTSGKLADNSVGSGKILPDAISLYHIGPNAAVAGQVIKWNGSDWVADYELPSGVIVMWNGTAATVPPGWALCDGNNGTPNLVDQFILGAANAGGYGGDSTASWDNHRHVVDLPPFNSSDALGLLTSRLSGGNPTVSTLHYHSVDPPVDSTKLAGKQTISIMPPYYKLAYIMKL